MGGIKKSKDQLLLLYCSVMDFLHECNIKLTLFYGSLLGYHRDNDFIEGDDDVDFIISEDDYRILSRYLALNLNRNPKIKVINLKNQLIQFFYEGLGPFDIYIYGTVNDDILLQWDGNLLFSKSDVFPLQKVIFKNFDVYIPNNTNKIVVDTYGINWRVPQVKNIDYIWSRINTVRKLEYNKVGISNKSNNPLTKFYFNA